MQLPFIKISGTLKNFSPSLSVKVASTSFMFMNLSICYRVPLYVSPVLSTTNYSNINTIYVFSACFNKYKGNRLDIFNYLFKYILIFFFIFKKKIL